MWNFVTWCRDVGVWFVTHCRYWWVKLCNMWCRCIKVCKPHRFDMWKFVTWCRCMKICKVGFCRVLTNRNGIILRRTSVSSVRHSYPTRNLCKFCMTFIPVPGNSMSSVRPRHNTRGTGAAFSYLPGTSVSFLRPCHNTRNLCEFCNTSVPGPGTSLSYVRTPCRYPELIWLL